MAYSYPDHGGGGGMTCNVPLNEINIHAYRHFRKLYPRVEGESWLKMQDGYIVSFTGDSMQHQVHFDLRGNFLYTVKYYSQSLVSSELKGMIQKKYPDYVIDVVTEITDGEKTLYLIKIENSSSVKTLAFADGRMEVYEELINGGINSRLVRN